MGNSQFTIGNSKKVGDSLSRQPGTVFRLPLQLQPQAQLQVQYSIYIGTAN